MFSIWASLKFCRFSFDKEHLQTINKINVTKNLKFVLGRVENTVEKEKMLVTSIFFFSHNVFKGFFLRGVKSRDSVV